MKRLLKEPLLHFFIVGFGLFLVFGWVSNEQRPGSGGPDPIVVDRGRLLAFIQYRSKVFEISRAEETLDNLPEDKLQALVDDYVREEALFREAKALKLDEGDYGSRQRLIRQLEFINQGFIFSAVALSETDLQHYLDTHKDRYHVPATITFTHVFFNAEIHGEDKARALARTELNTLNESRVPFHKALSHGDRYLYHRNYVNKDTGEIASHFGADMQRQLFALDADDTNWHGPFRSPYGFHLVMVTKQTAGYGPPLSQVRDRVEQDAIQDRVRMELDEINQSIVDGYEVEVGDLRARNVASTEGAS